MEYQPMIFELDLVVVDCKPFIFFEWMVMTICNLKATFWIKQWSLLSKEEEGRMLKEGCKHLEGMVVQLFSSSVWKNLRRIGV
ncbi:hypothetical protein BDA96_09G164800 [Sorghum bicolor]|uniref:Uncharacterized protein n=2 Tax=Sorghum bicolor TaxID=4558 RepID=A0A921U4C8_SORBI|nr:hypothetical protein BDA96_09G164800 [Sorghum bicolor]OQU78114.1 hypothetical protein SORBI_3009G157050 [Sorghum bicolor]